jgi:Fe2+ transport system protein FeoA
MVMLNQLKSGSFARIVKIENRSFIRKKLNSKGIFEGSFIRVISCFGLIVFKIEKKTFSIDDKLAEKIRVIELL